jgi:pimeloyl-ACP methyl ester carboxylesterase
MRSIQKRAAVAQPVVFVLPGIMGSELERDGGPVWLNYIGLLAGGLSRISDVDDPKVAASGLIGDYYGDLCQYLSDTHQVVPFAYDWRNSIRKAGADLGKAVAMALAASGQPVRFVAHSMGGLVVRSFIAQHPDLWKQVCSRPGGRFLMLGTPNRGSHSMVETLLGMATTIKQLALLDVMHDRQEILDIVAAFRGALELLPQKTGDERDWFAAKLWADLRKLNKDLGGLPSAAFLSDAQSALAELPIEIPGADRVLYVAGASPSTPCGLEIDEARGRLLLLTTDAGDSKVTYEAGKLPGVATWYAPAEHGDLANHKPAFPAFLQLLNEGQTAQLPTSPPAMARGVRTKIPYVPRSVLYPTEPDLVASLLGARPRRYQAGKLAGFKASVVHGDLRHARFPIMAGHYDGDTISGAEGYLDRRLDHALSQRYQLGIYPGPLGTSTVVLREPDSLQKELGIPRGAVIIGLGAMGELAQGTLANAVRRGALNYAALAEDRHTRARDVSEGGDQALEIGLTFLLIGANSAANITVEDSVSAVLRAIAQANREIAGTGKMAARIDEIEIIELYADVAIQAAHALKDLASDIGSELDVRIDAADLLRQGSGGAIRVTPNLSTSVWRRWIITAENPSAGHPAPPVLPAALVERVRSTLSDPAQVDATAWNAVLGLAFPEPDRGPRPAIALRYVALADRARAEVRVQQGQPELIERLVRISVRDTQFKMESARTLFELMIPNALKDTLAQLSRLVMVVDAETAAYPWELMADGPLPVCVEVGLVRQLQTGSFRSQIRATTVNAAYVVGDPLTSEGVPPLPAAGEEAQQVAAMLGGHFDVTHTADRPSAMDVLDGLFARPYRIVHLAGHGYYEPGGEADRRARSGMLLEDGIYLTAAEIGQMRQVPDLVFLNCCYLAQVGSETGKRPFVPYNRLAASISRELIEMGVRAVVAAGWAVRDDAANVFARAFYDEMLSGGTFGDALQEARRRTWQRFPDCNTWGAYQAYGDPDFRLKLTKARGAGRDAKWVAPQEMLQELEDLVKRFHDQEHVGKTAELVAKISELVNKCPPAWLARGDVVAAIGTAYGEAPDFRLAVEYLQKAVQAEDAGQGVPMRVVEQLANFEARWGKKSGDPKLIARAIERLTTLNGLAETGERLSLLGSAHKRLAQVVEGKERAEALSQAATWYRRAAERKLAGGEADPYPALNWLTVAAVLGNVPPDAPGWLARARAAAKERYAESRSIWDAVTLPDAALVEHLLDGALDAESGDGLVAKYRATFEETRATARERDSVLGQLDFIATMAPAGGIPAASVKQVQRIREELAEPVAGATADAAPEQTPRKARATRKRASPKAKTPAAAKRKTAKKRRKPGLS